jgi:hypothetical protein
MVKVKEKDSKSYGVIEKPPLSMLPKGVGRAQAVAPESDPAREARIRDAAYALYEARGYVHGCDVDDWLAAAAALDAKAEQAEPKPPRRGHRSEQSS